MNMMAQVYIAAGQVLLAAVPLALLAGRFVPDMRKRRIAVFMLLVLCMLVPVNALTVAQWLRSVVGDLSVITFAVLLNILLKRLKNINIINELSLAVLLLGIALAGVVFYPLALGLGTLDPYRFGFAPVGMSLLLALLSAASWLRGLRDLAVVLLLPLLAFNLHLLESVNLWDYLLDPVLVIYAVVQSAAYIRCSRFFKQGA
jgi:hypothetical protein